MIFQIHIHRFIQQFHELAFFLIRNAQEQVSFFINAVVAAAAAAGDSRLVRQWLSFRIVTVMIVQTEKVKVELFNRTNGSGQQILGFHYIHDDDGGLICDEMRMCVCVWLCAVCVLLLIEMGWG